MKAKFFALAALLFGLAACQTEPEGLDVNLGGEQEVMLTVSLPEATRANSAQGFVLDSLRTTDYSLRYILEIYRADGETVFDDTCQRFVKTSDLTTMAFPVKLVPGRDYRIVAWADIVEGESEDDRYYYTEEGLDNVVIKDNGTVNWNPMDETRDAYTGTQLVVGFNSSTNIPNMTLTRPFAKLRVVSTDIEEVRKLGIKPTSAVAEYTQDMDMDVYYKYNALTERASDARAKSHTFTYTTTATQYVDNDGEYTLFTDYIFVNEGDVAKFSLVVKDANNTEIKTNHFNTDIFVQRNTLTTIKGDVLTLGENIVVNVNGDIHKGDTHAVVNSAEDLQDAIDEIPDNNEGNITLGGNIDLSDLLAAGTLSTRANETAGLVIPAGKSVILDLNGYTISQTKEQTGAYAMIDNQGTLTIEDRSANKSGKIAYGDNGNGGNYVSNTISNSGVLTINGGTIENNSSATVASNGYPHPIDNSGVLTINGGTFTNTANYSSMRIWCTTDDDTIVTINGGTFNGSIDFQTPSAAANKGTLTINDGTFNADTYTNCSVRLLGFGADVDEMNGYIKGGVFNGAIALKNWSGSELNSKVFDITGGTFDQDPSNFLADGYKAEEANGVWTVVFDPAAKIGSTEYATLQEAFNVGGDITLLRNVTVAEPVVLAVGKTVVLDLNGKTITATDYAIENFGTLKINGNGTINGIVYCEATGKTTVENGTFNALESGKYVFLNSQGGTLTINGGTINGGSSYPIYSYDENSSLVINDVTVNATFGCVNAYGTNGSVEINGGTFQMTGVQGKTSHITYFSSKIVATINGGTFEKIGDISMSATGGGGICVNGGANLTINGGTFAGDYDDVYNYGGTISVKGGEYKFKPDFVAEGYKATEVNGMYMVVAKEVVVVSTAADVLSAMKVAGQTVYIVPTADGSAYKLDGKMSLAEGVKLIGMGDTPVALFNDWGSNAFANQAHFTNTYVENINFTNNLVIDAGIVTGDVKFVNCVFGGDRAHQGVHFDSGNGKLTFENCTFVGRNMLGASIEKVTFNSCYFENKRSSLTGADKWTGVNMWGKYEFNNCTFDTEAHCNVKCDDVVAAFNNCSYTDNRDIREIISNSNNYDAVITFDVNK